MKTFTFQPRVSNFGRTLFVCSALGFVASALVGTLASIEYIQATQRIDWITRVPMEKLRPLHLLLATIAMVMGAMAITNSLLYSLQSSPSRQRLVADWITTLGILGFTLVAVASVLNGKISGREYVSWPSYATPFLLASIAAMGWRGILQFRSLQSLSPEGSILLGIGWLLTFSGFIEAQLFLIPWVFENGVRDLTSQWHGIDTFVAGINVILYAGMIFLMQHKPKPLRKTLLFTIAGFGLLGTFGHHHYVSPQPGYLKVFAFLASMVAVISFVRHLHGVKREMASNQRKDPVFNLLLTAEFWTLVAVGSGILFAIPPLNFYVHGTYLIIIHAMGSMIGINFVIMIAAASVFCHNQNESSAFSNRSELWLLNGSLLVLWVGLAIPSVIKGILRTNLTFQQYMPRVEPWLLVFPVAGMGLLWGILLLSGDLILAILAKEERPG
ncbi:MAG: cbb3-type cytochrome c oxidase subunit I [Oceanipulchritudo sp.]